MSKYLMALCWLLAGCTLNISIAQTEGEAHDVIDDTQAPTNDIPVELPKPGL
jgi:hypothetical protein